MKNLYLIPTDKSGRVGRFVDTQELILRSVKDIPRGENVNIYITSDEEIKEGDWYLDTFNTQRIKANEYSDHKHYGNSCKKIILTTDQDLINDGVQSIDEKFLEWFVNNPSCEEVEVKLENYYASGALQPNLWQYKVIIPKDEPKQTFDKSKYISGIDPYDKKETLEKVAERLYPIILEDDGWDKNKQYRDEWIEGAKYQAERMYSEEDMRKAFQSSSHTNMLDIYNSFEDFIEQFKKK